MDGVEGHPHSRIVNDRAVAIDAPTLAELNEKDGENIATGWHAIEVPDQGQDRRSDGPGNRLHGIPRWAGGECRQASRIPEGGHRFAGQRPGHAGARMGAVSAELPQPLRRPAGKSAENRFGPGILSRGELAGERIEVALDSKAGRMSIRVSRTIPIAMW